MNDVRAATADLARALAAIREGAEEEAAADEEGLSRFEGGEGGVLGRVGMVGSENGGHHLTI